METKQQQAAQDETITVNTDISDFNPPLPLKQYTREYIGKRTEHIAGVNADILMHAALRYIKTHRSQFTVDDITGDVDFIHVAKVALLMAEKKANSRVS